MVPLSQVPFLVINILMGEEDHFPCLRSLGKKAEKWLPRSSGKPLDNDMPWSRSSLSDIPDDLVAHGFALVSASSTPTTMGHVTKRTAYAYQFIFAKPDLADPFLLKPNHKLEESRETLMFEFDSFLNTMLGSMQAFHNQVDGKPDQEWLSLSLSKCEQRDDRKRVVPKFYLYLRDNRVILDERG